MLVLILLNSVSLNNWLFSRVIHVPANLPRISCKYDSADGETKLRITPLKQSNENAVSV